MFYYLSGTVALLGAGLAVIDCGGVGYRCFASNHTLAQLQTGKSAKLFTHCNIREDAFDIFGFATREELECFELLLGVSGVGPKAALALLSTVSPDQLTLAVVTQDEKTLTRAPGVGKKMASRILLELKDKLGGAQMEMRGGVQLDGAGAVPGGKVAEATAALASLGYSQSEIGLALKGIEAESLPVEEIVRQALRAMVMK